MTDREIIEEMSEAYWNAGKAVPRWPDESDDQQEIVRQRMAVALNRLRLLKVVVA